jgi:DNA/RNA-binding domain of Phe-tRNA-synthetase-like protein
MSFIPSFDIEDTVQALGVRGTYFMISGLRNADTHEEFAALCENITERVRHDLSEEHIENDPILKGFRRLHDAVGASNRKHVSSPENLLLHVLRTGRLPHVNLIVDIYNLVSLESRLALGAHDLAKISGNIHLRRTTGTEGFIPLGLTEAKPARPNVYAYVDDSNDVLCYLEVRQVEKTKVTLDTTSCFYIVQGNEATSSTQVSGAMERLTALTVKFCGGTVTPLKTVN